MQKKTVKIISSVLLIPTTVFFIIALYTFYIEIYKVEKNLTIFLNGSKNIETNFGEKYIEYGAKASYKDKDLTKNIIVENNINHSKLGEYKIIYKIKYKRLSKKIERTVKIIDKKKPVMTLNNDENIILYVGNKYIEYGASAKDNYDGDITKKIIIKGNVNTKKVGKYTVIYIVKDSSKNTRIITRNVEVKEKSQKQINQKIAVLNYHFFYKDWSENCHEIICENIKTFEKHLEYLNNNGFKTLKIKEFIEWIYGEKSVLITIDDGAHGTGKHNGNHLIPLLEKYNINATLFLITGWWDINNYKSDKLDVESHTNNLHEEGNCGYRSKLNCIKYQDLLNDLNKSIEVTKSNNAFCFPFYEYTNESIKAVKEAGFKAAFTGGERKASRNGDKYKIPRYVIQDDTSMESFISYVN